VTGEADDGRADVDSARAHVAGADDGTFDDAWQHIRTELEFDRHVGLRSVQDKLGWYRRNQEYLDRVCDRARPYLHYVVSELERRGMPLDLALLPIVESAYHPFAHSRSRASGIWQFIPSTGRRYGLKQNWWYDGRRDIVAATGAALDYLQALHAEFGGDWLLALAAYNSGERNVARAVERNRRSGKDIDFWSLAPHLPRETRGYVPSLLAVAELLANAEHHGIRWQAIPDEPYFELVAIDGQIDLATAAALAELSMDEFYTLNPGFNQWATDPDGPHYVLIPVDRVERFVTGLHELPADQRITWKRHTIGEGETLGSIARRYRTSVAALQQANGLRGNAIRSGDSLLIPEAKHAPEHYTLSADARRGRYGGSAVDGDGLVHTVRRGDTLWDISRRYGISLDQLCSWNGLTRSATLRPGQRLNIAGPAESTGRTVAVALEEPARAPAGYTVRKGDSLWLISRRFRVSVAQLQEWNGLRKGTVLQPGQTLIVKPPAADSAGA
jgi:membrane-bound lytic murein transglycosylase D